jgi:hypothetical protein
MIKAAAVGTHDRERLLILRYAGEHSWELLLIEEKDLNRSIELLEKTQTKKYQLK